MQDGMNNGMKSEMNNIKANGNKFLVEIKNNQGEYEPLGVLSFHEAVEIQFTTHRAVRFQRISGLEDAGGNRLGKKVGCQLFTKGELCRAVSVLQTMICADMEEGRLLTQYVLVGTYMAPDGQGELPMPQMAVTAEAVEGCIARMEDPLADCTIESYITDERQRPTEKANHGIVIRNGRIASVY